MKYRDYFQGLNPRQRDAYARRAATSVGYIQTHLMSTPPRKVPRRELLRALASATQGRCSLEEVLAHFYSDEEAAA